MRTLSAVAIAVFLTTQLLPAQTEVTIVSPGSVQPSVEQLIGAFERKTGKKVQATFASGGVTRQQIVRGEVFDVMILQPPYADVMASGNVNEASATPLASISLGIATRAGMPKPDISTPEAVKKLLLGAKGVAYPDEPGGASGIAFMKVLNALGIAEQMRPTLKHGHNGASTMDFVLNGEADYGVTFMSGLTREGLQAIGPLPAELAPPTRYVGFLGGHAKDAVTGRELLDFLASNEGAAAWTSRGFSRSPAAPAR